MCPNNDDITIVDGIPVSRVHTSLLIKDSITGHIATITTTSMPSGYSLILPAALGTDGQALVTDASGHLSWQTVEADPVREEPYSEVSYTDGKVSGVEIYDSASKVVHLYTKSFVYSGNVLMSVTITRVSDSATFTTAFSYTDGILTNITKTHTP